MGKTGRGLFTTLHYADGLKGARNDAFRSTCAKTCKSQPDAYAVQGYDSAQLLGAGLKAVKGDTTRRDNAFVEIAAKGLADPARGCKM